MDKLTSLILPRAIGGTRLESNRSRSVVGITRECHPYASGGGGTWQLHFDDDPLAGRVPKPGCVDRARVAAIAVDQLVTGIGGFDERAHDHAILEGPRIDAGLNLTRIDVAPTAEAVGGVL